MLGYLKTNETEYVEDYRNENQSYSEAFALMASICEILQQTKKLHETIHHLALVTPTMVNVNRPDISFELKCKKLLEAMGFLAEMTQITSDGGIDIIATRSETVISGKYIVQCKNWRDNVGVKPVRELYGVVVSEDANKGVLIASSGFTQSAIKFATDKRLELIDGKLLDKLFLTYVVNSSKSHKFDLLLH